MTWTARSAAPAAALGVAALALSACGGTDTGSDVEAVEVGTATVSGDAATDDAPAATGDDSTGDDTGGTTDDSTLDDSTLDDSTTDDDTTAAGTAPTTDAAAAAPAGLPPRPERDRCVDLPEAADGVYTVYEAGTATVTATDGRLTLVDVQAGDGWTSRVDDEEGEKVQVDFRPDGQDTQDVLDLEVEVDDGRVQVQVCNDDD